MHVPNRREVGEGGAKLVDRLRGGGVGAGVGVSFSGPTAWWFRFADGGGLGRGRLEGEGRARKGLGSPGHVEVRPQGGGIVLQVVPESFVEAEGTDGGGRRGVGRGSEVVDVVAKAVRTQLEHLAFTVAAVGVGSLERPRRKGGSKLRS